MYVRVYFCLCHWKALYYHTISIEQERCLEGCRFGQMVVTIPKLQREDLGVDCQMTGNCDL